MWSISSPPTRGPSRLYISPSCQIYSIVSLLIARSQHGAAYHWRVSYILFETLLYWAFWIEFFARWSFAFKSSVMLTLCVLLPTWKLLKWNKCQHSSPHCSSKFDVMSVYLLELIVARWPCKAMPGFLVGTLSAIWICLGTIHVEYIWTNLLWLLNIVYLSSAQAGSRGLQNSTSSSLHWRTLNVTWLLHFSHVWSA